MDALVPPDVKPDIKPDVKTLGHGNAEESFATRAAKGSKRILIDEYPAPKSPGKVKPNPATNDASTSDPSTVPLRGRYNKNVTKCKLCDKIAEPNDNTTASVKNITDVTECDKKGLVPTGTIRTVDVNEIKHRKQKHRVGINSDLLRWLWEDPTRLPQAREDLARWTQFMATEMSNPAFQIFLAMVCNFKNTVEKPATTRTIHE